MLRTCIQNKIFHVALRRCARCQASTDSSSSKSSDPSVLESGSTTKKPLSYEIPATDEKGKGNTKIEEGKESKIWEDPWRHALGPPPSPPKYTRVVESKEEWKWVERLFPLKTIPEVPKHSQYPTPSGWRPPRDPPPDLPYYVRRLNTHLFPLYLEIRRDQLDPTTMEFDYKELIVLKNVQGDVFACERDLKEFLERKLKRKVGTNVNEPQGKIRVNGVDKTDLEEFLMEKGF